MTGTALVVPNEQTSESLYRHMEGDPGAKPDDHPPFPIKVGERFRFYDGLFKFANRTKNGEFLFISVEDASAPLLRSSWRLAEEFRLNILIRIDQGIRARPSQALLDVAENRVPTDKVLAAQSGEDAVAFILNRLREEQTRRAAAGLPLISLSGPREAGVRSAPTHNPANLDEFIGLHWQSLGRPESERPHWKTVNGKRAETDHLPVVTGRQLIDGRSLAKHPLRAFGERKDVILDVLETQYATRPFASVAGAQLEVNRRLRLQSLKLVGRVAVENQLKTLDGFELCRAKQGTSRAKYKYRTTGKLSFPEEPGTRVEFDWHCFDLENEFPATCNYLSEYAGRLIPRVWLTAGIDTATAGLWGYSWSIGSVRRADVMRAFSHMMRPKPCYAHMGVIGKWLPHGKMKSIAYDHGQANLAFDITRAIINLDIENALDKKGEPVERPNVERFFGTTATMFISQLPGALGRNTLVRPEEVSPLEEILAADELNKRFIKFIVDGYAIRSGRTRPLSPNGMWLQYKARNPAWSPDTARSEAELDQELRISITRTAGPEGCEWKRLFYNDPIHMRKIRSDHQAHMRGNPKVELRIKPDNVADAIVLDPNKENGGWRPTDCMYRGYAPGKSVELHTIVNNAVTALKKKERDINEATFADTFHQITQRVREKSMRRGKGGRARVAAAAKLAQLQGPGGTDFAQGILNDKPNDTIFTVPHQKPLPASSPVEESFDAASAHNLLLTQPNSIVRVESDLSSEQDPPRTDNEDEF